MPKMFYSRECKHRSSINGNTFFNAFKYCFVLVFYILLVANSPKTRTILCGYEHLHFCIVQIIESLGRAGHFLCEQ